MQNLFRIAFFNFLWLTSGFLLAQNLIPNPGFENCAKCQNGFFELGINSGANDPIDWYAATYGTSDFKSDLPNSGKLHGGFFVGYKKFEYLANHLESPLIAGAKYQCSFYIRLFPNGMSYALDEIGIYFQNGKANFPQAEPLSKLKAQFTTPDRDYILSDHYRKFTFEFIACGGEDQMIVGRMNSWGEADTLLVASKPLANLDQAYPYYLVDDFDLHLIDQVENRAPDTVRVCDHQKVKISLDSSGIYEVLWSNGSDQFSTEIGGESAPLWVEYKFGKDCSSFREDIALVVDKKPNVELKGLLSLCPGKALQVEAVCDGECLGFLWPDGSTGNTFEISEPGKFELQYKWRCQSESLFFEVDTPDYEKDFIITSDVGQICYSDSTFLRASVPKGCLIQKWSNGATDSEIKVFSPGIYELILDCPCGEIKGKIDVKATANCTPIRFPNTIIINGEEVNRTFGPAVPPGLIGRIAEYQLFIFNRWGDKVFETNDIQQRWIPDNNLPSESYIFSGKLNYSVSGNSGIEKYQFNGGVSVIK